MKKFKTEQEFKNFLIQQINFEPNISLVIEADIVDEILESIDFKMKSYSKNVNSNYYTYLIDKYEDDETGDINLNIEPVEFNDDGILETEIKNGIIIVQDGLLDDEDIENIIEYDEPITIDYNDEDEMIDCDRRCDECSECTNTEELKEDPCKQLADMIEEYALLIEDTNGCPECIRETLLEMSADLLENFKLQNKED